MHLYLPAIQDLGKVSIQQSLRASSLQLLSTHCPDICLKTPGRQEVEQKKLACSAGWIPYPAVTVDDLGQRVDETWSKRSSQALLDGYLNLRQNRRTYIHTTCSHSRQREDKNWTRRRSQAPLYGYLTLRRRRVRYPYSGSFERLLLQLLSSRCPGWRHAV